MATATAGKVDAAWSADGGVKSAVQYSSYFSSTQGRGLQETCKERVLKAAEEKGVLNPPPFLGFRQAALALSWSANALKRNSRMHW